MKPKGFEENRPPLPDDLVWVWNAYQELGSCRVSGFGAGPIPWTAIHEYALRYGIGGDAFESFRFLVRHMDGVALKFWQSKQDEGKANGRRKGPSAKG